MPFTLPAVDASTFNPDGVAAGADGSLDVLDVLLPPPPHAATDAASATLPTAVSRRGALTQTFRKSIDISSKKKDMNNNHIL